MNRRRQPAMGLTTLTAWCCAASRTRRAWATHALSMACRGAAATLLRRTTWCHHDFPTSSRAVWGSDERPLVDYCREICTVTICLLLCDGVPEAIPGAMCVPCLARILPVQALADELVQGALRCGSRDNLTTLVVQVRGVSEPHCGMEAPCAPVASAAISSRVSRLDGMWVMGYWLIPVSTCSTRCAIRQLNMSSCSKSLHPQRARDDQERHHAGTRGMGCAACRPDALHYLAHLHAGAAWGHAPSGFYFALTGMGARRWTSCWRAAMCSA